MEKIKPAASPKILKTHPANSALADDSPVAVVDIGSNSVRLVIFDGVNRVPRVLFNEKVLCGLGRGLSETQHLHPGGRAQALATLSRFEAVWRGVGVCGVIAVATAAVRDARDGTAFCTEAEAIMGAPIRILSGAEEGIYSALGVLSGLPKIDGVIGDLGGGSLEFARICDGQVHEVISLPLGPQRLPSPHNPRDPENAAYILEQLRDLSWGKALLNKPLIAVGGAWRSIARAHMQWETYPLPFLHGYSLTSETALDISTLIAQQSQRSALKMVGVAKRRLSDLPAAALVLQHVIKQMRPSTVLFSAYGLREGLIYDQLSQTARQEDPLIASCEHYGRSVQRQVGFGAALADWTADIFDQETSSQERLRRAACALADIAWHQHPDYRDHHARDVILRTPLLGLSHPDRAFLAAALWTRYGSRIDHDAIASLVDLMREQDTDRAVVLGHAMRLGVSVSAGATGVLSGTRLMQENGSLILDLGGHPEWHGETTDRRLAALAHAMNVTKFDVRD